MKNRYSSNPYSDIGCYVCGEASIGCISYDSDNQHNFLYHYFCDFHWKRESDKRLKAQAKMPKKQVEIMFAL